MRKLSIGCFCLITACLFSQMQELKDQPLDQVILLVNAKNPKYENIEGSPYLNEQYLPAKINDYKETSLVHFNAAENSIEVMIDESKALTLRKTDSYTIQLLDGSDREYQTHTFINDKAKPETSFFELLHRTKDYQLYLKENIKFIEMVENKNPYQDDIPAKFLKVSDTYFVSNFISESPELLAIPKKRKQFPGLFKERSEEIGKFIKREKLNIGEPKDLVRIFNFYFGAD